MAPPVRYSATMNCLHQKGPLVLVIAKRNEDIIIFFCRETKHFFPISVSGLVSNLPARLEALTMAKADELSGVLKKSEVVKKRSSTSIMWSEFSKVKIFRIRWNEC